jgi:biopolymer transport protein ExbD
VVTGTGYQIADTATPVLVVSPTRLAMGTKEPIALRDGLFDGTDKAGGGGRKIPKLTAWLAVKPNDGSDSLVIALDHHIPYRTFLEILYTASRKEAGWKRFLIMACAGAHVVILPIELPNKVRTPPSPDPPPEMVVSVTKTRTLVWSISGLEGTQSAPKETFALGPTTSADVQGVLAEIVARRYPDGKRPTPAHYRIIIQSDGTNQLGTLAELLGSIRATADGKELFPDVLLSSGFD